MDYIQITKENIDKEHICCAMSGKQSLAKKEWLKQRFAEGLVFYRSVERGKCFIEYIPAENAWVPITADGWLYINCLWVSGAMKGHGCSNDLLEKCLHDAKAQGKKGICILCAEGRKREFLADPKFLSHKGFEVADVSDCGITLMCLPLNADTALPKFKNCAKHPKADGKASSSTTPISVPLPITGCRRCSRPRSSITSRSGPSTSPTKKPRRMYPHPSQPTHCSGTAYS